MLRPVIAKVAMLIATLASTPVVGVLADRIAKSATGAGKGYHLANKFEIGGPCGWDYIAVDPESRRLYVPHVSQVDVLDADTGKHVGEIADTPGVHGIALAPELRKAFTSNGKADTVSVISLDTLSHTAEIKVGKDPDAIIYDPGTKHVFVSNGESDDITVIDAVAGKVDGTIELGAGPEYLAADGKGTLWVNVQEKNSFATIDAKNLKVVNVTPIPGCEAPTSLAADPQSRRLFIGCRGGTLAFVNADSGKVLKTLPIGQHVDATVFDTHDHLIFTSTGDGFITIVHEDSPDSYTVVDKVATLRGAKTMTFDPKTGKIFLPTAENLPPGLTGPPRGSEKASPFVVLAFAR
jgi:YVTN family beta-propeller protein